MEVSFNSWWKCSINSISSGFWFGAGGSDFKGNFISEKHNNGQGQHKENKQAHPFGGGSGAGVSISPVAFLVVGSNGVQVLHLNSSTHLIEKALNTVPSTVDKFVNNRQKWTCIF